MKLILFVNAAIFLAFVKVFETPSMIPLYVTELNITYAQAGIFMTAYTLIRCFASLPAGSITDRWGAVKVIAICLFSVFALGMLGTFSNNYYYLLLMRILVSTAIAVIFIAAIDAIPKYLPPEKVGRGIGYINGSLNLGIALAMFVTPILADALGWRWTARAYSLLFLALLFFSLPLLKNPPSRFQ
ncbi:MAG: MFS transporter [Gammaproteobacteria bacterium]|nr:MFS transporter [Gammaproteobacteria bacterium]